MTPENRGRATRVAVLLGLGALAYLLFLQESDQRASRTNPAERASVEVSTDGAQTTAKTTGLVPHDNSSNENAEQIHVHGTVVTESGDPLAGVQVYIGVRREAYFDIADLRDRQMLTLTGTDGRFALPKATMDGDLIARKEGYVPVALDLEGVAAEGEAVIVMKKGAAVSGRVVTVGGDPVPSARVIARSAPVGRQLTEANVAPSVDFLDYGETLASADGRYQLTGLREGGTYLVEAYLEGYVQAKTRSRDFRYWVVVPPELPIDIEMHRAAVAILGLRSPSGPVTHLARMPAWDPNAVSLPDAIQGLATLIPEPNLSSRVARRLNELRKNFAISFAAVDPNSIGPGREVFQATLRYSVLDLTNQTLSFEYRPIGSANWDKPQWHDIGERTGLSLGKLVLKDTSQERVLPRIAIPTKSVGVFWGATFRQNRRGPNELLLPAGKYRIVRTGIGAPSYSAIVSPGQTTDLEVNFPPPPLLSIQPRLASGAPLSEVGIYLLKEGPRGRRNWLKKVMYPLGCRYGPEVFAIGENMKGEVGILIKKRGFTELVTKVTLEDSDFDFTPTLVPR